MTFFSAPSKFLYAWATLFQKKEKNFRSNHHRCSIKKIFSKISQNSQQNTCTRVSFLIKLQGSGLQLYKKRDSCTDAFLWNLRNFQEHFFYRTPSDDWFWNFRCCLQNFVKFLTFQLTDVHHVERFSQRKDL